jgi:hypothetical protein
MTGQVKEDILVTFGELGVFVKEGQLLFSTHACSEKKNFWQKHRVFEYYNIREN